MNKEQEFSMNCYQITFKKLKRGVMEMITNYVYLFAVVLLFLIIVIKAMDELVYQRKIKKIIGIIICYPFYVIIAYYLLVKF